MYGIYGPTIYEENFFPMLTKELLSLSDYTLIIEANMNTFWDLHMDRSHHTISATQVMSSEALGIFTKILNLNDIWRVLNPTAKNFTFYSAPHKMSSTIDYILSSAKLVQFVQSVSILPRILSDHNPIIGRFNFFPCLMQTK